MQNFFNQLFAIPDLPDVEQAQTARFLVRFAWINIVLFPLSMLSLLILSPEQFVRPLVVTFVVTPVFILILFLTKRGKVRLASLLLVGLLWLTISLLAYTGGGIFAPSYIGYYVVAFMAGILLGGRATFIMTAVCSLFGLFLVYLANTGHLPPAQYKFTPFPAWIVTTVFMVFLAFLQYYNRSLAKRSLDRARGELVERTRTEKKLSVSEEKFSKAFMSSPDSIIISDLASGRYVDVNESFLRDTGYERSEIIGFTSLERNVWASPEDRDRLIAGLQAQGFVRNLEAQYRRKTGEIRDALVSAEIFEFGHEEKHLLAVVRDITDMKRAETQMKQAQEALHRERHLLRVLIDNLPDLVFMKDRQSRFLVANQVTARFMGVDSPKQLIGRTDYDFYPQELAAQYFAVEQQIMQTGENIIGWEHPQLDLAQNEHWLSSYKFAVVDEEGQNTSLVGIERDITERKRAEESLRLTEARNRALIENAPDGIVLLDADGRFKFGSPSAFRMFGYTPEETLGQRAINRMHPEDQERVHAEFVNLFLDPSRAPILHYRFMHKNGSYLWIEGHFRNLMADPTVKAIVNNFRDITATRQAEAALHQQLAVEQVVAQISRQYVNIEPENRDAIVQSTLASLGRQVGVARSYIFLYDAARDEFSSAYEWCAEGIEPSPNPGQPRRTQDHPLLLQPLLRGETVNIPRVADLTDEDPGIEILKAQKVLSILCLPLTSEKGAMGLIGFDALQKERAWQEAEVSLLHVVGRIIANGLEHLHKEQEIFELNQSLERRVQERTEALRRSQERLQNVLDYASDLIQSMDEVGRYLYVNAAWCDTLGYTPEEANKLTMFDVIDSSYHQHCTQLLQELLETRTPHTTEVAFRTKSGKQVIVEGNINVHVEKGGRYVTQGFFRDITERKQAEVALRLSRDQLSAANAALEKASRLKDEFLASMSHELRTPLTGILGLSEVLQMQTYGVLNEKQLRSIKNIETSGRHLLDLINDILDLSKIEAGQLEMQFEQCELTDICQASLHLIKGMAHQKRQNVAFGIDPTTISIRADARRLKQMIVNLLSNAIKFTPQAGSLGLEVRADEEKRAVFLTVWDKGIGIKPEDIAKLFKPFVQLDSSLARQHSGTGLGLSLVQRMAEMHGGSVQVESTPGEGSRFTILLPWSPRNTPPAVEPSAPANILQGALTVEDSEVDAEQITRYLHELGIKNVVHPVSEGAVEQAARLKPGVILLDLNLPDGSGFDVLEKLKKDPRTQAIPVIICSVQENIQKALNLGAVGSLVKPFTLDEVRRMIGRIGETKENIEKALTIASSRRDLKVLMVDDNELNLETVSSYLSTQNMTMFTARSGLELLSIVSEVLPDIILMDIQMPGMDGLEATRHIRAHANPQVARTPIIALTALAMTGDREKCIAAGANDYMSKPVKLVELAEMIRKFG